MEGIVGPPLCRQPPLQCSREREPTGDRIVGPPSGGQSGATHLIMTLLLLAAATLFTLTVARTSSMEQRMSANEYQHTTLRLAAEAGLARGIAWLAGHLPDWQTP